MVSSPKRGMYHRHSHKLFDLNAKIRNHEMIDAKYKPVGPIWNLLSAHTSESAT